MITQEPSEIIQIVNNDIQNHKLHGVDLNPYSTEKARSSWQNGYSGVPLTMLDWYGCYYRGKTAKQVMNQIEEKHGLL